MTLHYEDDRVTLHHGDCLDVLRELPDASVDAVVTDPPYGLEFMGREWDGADGFRRSLNRNDVGRDNPFGRASRTSPEYRAGALFQEWSTEWARECLRVLKPGGHLLAFGGTRTWHRLACAVEDAGFEVRDSIAWLYGAGFPKSMNLDRIKNSPFCRCNMGESGYADSGSATEHGLHTLRDADVSTTERAGRGQGSVLLEGLSESGTPAAGPMSAAGSARRAERVMEGRRDAQAAEGELLGSAVRPLSAGVPGDGASGRLHHGAPVGHGSVDRAAAAADGGRESQGSRPVEQREGEPRAVSVERGSQAWGGWPVCERCSQPVIPAGLGTALKPAFEPVVVARKPLAGTVAANVLAHGTGALNIDGCRICGEDQSGWHRDARDEHALAHGTRDGEASANRRYTERGGTNFAPLPGVRGGDPAGRWPANVVLDESQAAALDEQSGELASGKMMPTHTTAGVDGRASAYGADAAGGFTTMETYGDSGGASRFFYVAKADSSERVRVNGTAHPTVKPLALMRWLVRLVTPPGGTVLEPFAGSGTTVEACLLEGFRCIAIEREADYLPLIEARLARHRDPIKAVALAGEDGGLFDLLDEETSA